MTGNAFTTDAPPSAFVQRFRADGTAPGLARKATREFLHRRAAQDEIETAVLLVSEIVTNSVVASEEMANAHISLSLRVAGTQLFAGVIDSAPGFPEASEPAPGDDHGYGLFIVSELSQRHGWFPMSSGRKCTYFLLQV